MAVHYILTVFDIDGFETGKGTFLAPYGGSKSWKNFVYMLGSEENEMVHEGQGTDMLVLKVKSGDIIKWLDTSLNQNVQTESDKRYDMVVYGMAEGDDWGKGLGPIENNKPFETHAYVKEYFKETKVIHEPAPVFAVDTPTITNMSTAHVRPGLKEEVTINYFLYVAKVDVSDPNNPTVVSWFKIDPKVEIKP